MKKILKFILILLPWFIGGLLFRSDTVFYKSLNKPVFAPPSILFPIVWTILYILIAIIIYVLAVIILRIFSKEEILSLPMGNKILKILEKTKIY